ncbi:hypothetical protein [Streptomyces sp. NPDC059262]|uniref:hypothetical protein n=1 Tax=Streptomyces sp. NPDC059262 TaxID=3346797 RepID=UPI00368B017B
MLTTMAMQALITSRAAGALQIEALVYVHRPSCVTVQVPSGEPTPATLSAVLRAYRTCREIGFPLTLQNSLRTLAGAAAPFLPFVAAGSGPVTDRSWMNAGSKSP